MTIPAGTRVRVMYDTVVRHSFAGGTSVSVTSPYHTQATTVVPLSAVEVLGDRIGTVRLSPEGRLAFRAESLDGNDWVVSGVFDAYWESIEVVQTWPVVYTPEEPK